MNLEQFSYPYLTIIGEGNFIKGLFHFSGLVRILGQVEGEIHLDEENSYLIIETPGEIEGKIIGNTIEVYGKVKGSIEARRKLILHPSAIVEGDVIAQSIEVAAGGILQGTTNTL